MNVFIIPLLYANINRLLYICVLYCFKLSENLLLWKNDTMDYILRTNSFVLGMTSQIFDLTSSVNAFLHIKIESNGFCGSTSMDIDIKDLAKFSADLCALYENLSGEARITEAYGDMYISFVCKPRGHIAVRGYLEHRDGAGSEQILTFENDIEQTYLTDFCYDLQNAYGQYLTK